MSRLQEVKNIYKEITNIITSSADEWKDFLEFSSRIYKYKFDNKLLIYAQKPDAMAVANMNIWNRIGRYINKATRSIAGFDKSQSPLVLEYLFDVSDTNGFSHTMPKLWEMDERVSGKQLDRLKNLYSKIEKGREVHVGNFQGFKL